MTITTIVAMVGVACGLFAALLWAAARLEGAESNREWREGYASAKRASEYSAGWDAYDREARR